MLDLCHILLMSLFSFPELILKAFDLFFFFNGFFSHPLLELLLLDLHTLKVSVAFLGDADLKLLLLSFIALLEL